MNSLKYKKDQQAIQWLLETAPKSDHGGCKMK